MHDAINKATVLFSVVDDLIFKRRETDGKPCCTANFLQYVCHYPLCVIKERIRPVLSSLSSRVRKRLEERAFGVEKSGDTTLVRYASDKQPCNKVTCDRGTGSNVKRVKCFSTSNIHIFRVKHIYFQAGALFSARSVEIPPYGIPQGFLVNCTLLSSHFHWLYIVCEAVNKNTSHAVLFFLLFF